MYQGRDGLLAFWSRIGFAPYAAIMERVVPSAAD